MTNPGTPPGTAGPSLSPLQKIGAATAAVAAISGGLGAAITRAVDSGAAHFAKCTDVQTVTGIRNLQFHAAHLIGDSVFVIPLKLDSAGKPTLDTARKYLATDSSFAVICTTPSNGHPPQIPAPQLRIIVDTAATRALHDSLRHDSLIKANTPPANL